MRRLFGIHRWMIKRGQSGKRFIKLVVKGNSITRVFEDVPNRDIRYITLLIFGKCFTIRLRR